MRKLTIVSEFLNLKERKIFKIVFILMLVSTTLEILSIGAIIPFFSFLLKGNLNYFYEIFNIDKINGGNYNLVVISISALILVFFLKNLFLVIFTWVDTSFYYNTGKRISDEVFKNYLNSKYLYLINKKNSRLVFNSSEATKMLRNALMSYTQIINEITVLTGISIFLFFLDYKTFSLIFLSLITIMLIIYYTVKNLNLRFGKEFKKYETNFLNTIIQTFDTIKDIKIKKKEQFFFNEFTKNNFQRIKFAHLNIFFALIPKYIIEFSIITVVLLIVFFHSSLDRNYDLLIIKLGVLSAAAVRLLPSGSRIISSFQRLNYCYPLLKDLKIELKENKKNASIKIKKYNSFSNKRIDSFHAKNLKFNYPLNPKKKIIEDLNLSLKKNQMTLITGVTGTGKTTLLDIITGLIEPQKGYFKINKVKYKSLPDFWVNNIAYVSQNIALMNSSIIKNILFGENEKNIDQKRLKKSVENAQLKNFIKNQKKGLNTFIGEKGVKISGGEKQRIALARAFYSNKKILVMDEATNALDKKIEAKIFRYLKKEAKGKIIVVISHDLSLNKYCKNLIKLNKGKTRNVK